MRISSQMQNASLINMQQSENYKNFSRKIKNEDKTKDTEDTKQVTKNVVVEKKDDTFILSKVDDKDKMTVLKEIQANSKMGLELSKYFQSDQNTEVQNNIKQVNQSIKSMSLTEYL